MFLTVAECLKLPSLRDCTVAAGKSGLNHIVNGATVLENYDNSLFNLDQPVNNSELILTSFSAIRDDVIKQCEHIQRMYQAGDAAVVIYYVGFCLPEIKPELIQIADNLGFPILVMPEKAMNRFYNEVLKEIYETLSSRKKQRNHLSDNIASLVSRLPENRKNINTLLRLISDNLKCTVLLTDATMNNICIAKWPAANSITADDIYTLFQKDADRDSYMVKAVFEEIPLHIFHMPFTAFAYRNFSIYVSDEFDTITMEDIYCIVDVLQLFSRLWDMDPNNILENSLVPSIIEGDRRKMQQVAAKLNIDITSITDALLLYPIFDEMEAKKRLQILRNMVKEMKRCAEMLNREMIVDIYDTCLVCFILDVLITDDSQDFYEELISTVDQVHKHYTYTIFPVNGNITDIPALYQLCDRYLSHAIAIFPQKKELTYSDVLFSKFCYDSLQQHGETNKILQHIIDLLSESNNHDELLNTLEVYLLDADHEVKKTSELLYVHRNTVQYRLNRIRSVTRTRSTDMTDNYLLRSAIGCWRLAKYLERN
ncbi:PucR family transcriptional regulator [Hornefia butyriciproducens]|uniref:PucR family transcriptional regulator n=1 Tax=Hornefia butyriciproducens TaxID=2652293 RepID=UPI003F89B2B7